jgi:mycofactocin precursor peptide peptidase
MSHENGRWTEQVTNPYQLANLGWPVLPASPSVLVPLGSTEQHGPHLPLQTDTTIATAVANGVADRFRRNQPNRSVFVAPSIAYGASGEHQDFPGTMSIGNEALRFLLIELVRSLSTWAGRIVIINAHGGNLKSLTDAVSQLIFEEYKVAWAPCVVEEADAHAGHTETSLMLHLAPDLVDMSRAAKGNVTPIEDLLSTITGKGVAEFSPSGVLGDPTTASSKEGARLLAWLVEDVCARIELGQLEPNGCLRRPSSASRKV